MNYIKLILFLFFSENLFIFNTFTSCSRSVHPNPSISIVKVKVEEAEAHLMPCKLQWVEYNAGDQLPLNLVPSHPGILQIARLYLTAYKKYEIGCVNTNTTGPWNKFISYHKNWGSTRSFQFLTNPNRCSLKWVNDPKGYNEKCFPTVEYLTIKEYIARDFKADQWLAFGSMAKSLDKHQVLVSISPGLIAKVYDFQFKPVELDKINLQVDLLGLDKIHNKAPVEVSQTLIHTKRVTESLSFTAGAGFSYSNKVSISATLGFPGVASFTASTEYDFSISGSVSRTINSEKSTEITLSRTITVPALTSVEACSTMKSLENFNISYEAKIEFSHEGMTGEEIKNVVQDRYTVIEIGEYNVIAEMNGTFSGGMLLQTEFVVVPIDSIMGCSELQHIITKKRNMNKKSKTNSYEIRELDQEISIALNQMTGKNLRNIYT